MGVLVRYEQLRVDSRLGKVMIKHVAECGTFEVANMDLSLPGK